jgi:hypothetical protein
MTLAGELVLVHQATALGRDRSFGPVVQRLDAVTSEIQDAVMRPDAAGRQSLRPLPAPRPRPARQLGKEIELRCPAPRSSWTRRSSKPCPTR